MHPSTKEAQQVELYGGHADGARATLAPGTSRFSTTLGTLYEFSAPWTEHKKRTVFVPRGFPGMPPQKTAA